MYTSSLAFNILTIFGTWKPINWNSNIYNYLYWIYTAITLTLFHLFWLLETLYLILDCEDSADFNGQLLYLLALTTACLKIDNLVFNRKRIVELGKILINPLCFPVTEEESISNKKNDEKIK